MSKTRGLMLCVLISSLFACGGEEGGELAILTIEPQIGPTQGEQAVKIGGQHFRTDIGYTIYFGSRRAGSPTILDPETLLVMTPRVEEASSVDITIRADSGEAFRIVDAYRYEDMGGNVVEQLGAPGKNKKGSLAY